MEKKTLGLENVLSWLFESQAQAPQPPVNLPAQHEYTLKILPDLLERKTLQQKLILIIPLDFGEETKYALAEIDTHNPDLVENIQRTYSLREEEVFAEATNCLTNSAGLLLLNNGRIPYDEHLPYHALKGGMMYRQQYIAAGGDIPLLFSFSFSEKLNPSF